ncbi:MAG TPA: glycosyltransferase [Candidatus Hodarchaeales archaeon]|nr:glycosyltransferase [Candidatus Hodarchaeales archaeon]
MSNLKIAVPIAAYEEGTTGEYVARAFRKLGHVADILSQWQFYDAFKQDEYDLYFCVDSGGPLNLFELNIATRPMNKLAFWMIDYRRGKRLKNPDDFRTCKLINSQGGWIFQSQYEDFLDCVSQKITRCSWLPLGADPDVWSNEPVLRKIYDVGFIGNVWDPIRQQMLDEIRQKFRLGFPGHGVARMEAGAFILRSSMVGFNISSFYTEPTAYDVNMRVFETLACSIPLITNWVPSLEKLGLADVPFVRTYRWPTDVVQAIRIALSDSIVMNSGQSARDYVLRNATYELRMKQALATLADQQSPVRVL